MAKEEVNKQELEQAVLKEREERQQRCTERVREICKEENCDIEAGVVIDSKGSRPYVNIVAR